MKPVKRKWYSTLVKKRLDTDTIWAKIYDGEYFTDYGIDICKDVGIDYKTLVPK